MVEAGRWFYRIAERATSAAFIEFLAQNAAVHNYYTPQGDTTRMQVNGWTRTSGAFEGMVDFDRAMQSASDPLNPAFDSGDHLHPNDAGCQATATQSTSRSCLDPAYV